jgi:hypothetical protein
MEAISIKGLRHIVEYLRRGWQVGRDTQAAQEALNLACF